MSTGRDTPRALGRPERVGPYVLRAVIGVGGSAVVHAAIDERDGRPVALKIASRSADWRAGWFRREASLAARLRHPHVVRLVAAGTLDDERPYLVLEHVDGPNLEAIADTLDRDAIVEIGSQLLDALTYAHDVGVVHCDLKPSNVLVASRGPVVVKLTDFGLASARRPLVTEWLGSRVVAGTAGYLSPEQARGAMRVGPRSDLYSLGALLYRLVTGHAPHDAETLWAVLVRTRSVDVGAPVPRAGLAIEEGLLEVIARLLSREAELRYASAAHARDAWERAARGARPSFAASRATTRRDPREAVATEAFAVPQPTMRLDHSTTWKAVGGSEVRAREPGSGLIVGRAREVASVVGALRDHDVTIEGARGIGRTRVLTAACDALADEGALVVRVSAPRGSASTALGTLAGLALRAASPAFDRDAFDAAERVASALDDAGIAPGDPGRDALVGALLALPLPVATTTLRLSAYRAFDALIARAAAARRSDRVVLAIDDADAMDADSRDVLERLLAREDGRVRAVVTATSALVLSRETRTITLAPLEEADVRALLEAHGVDAPGLAALAEGAPATAIVLAAAWRRPAGASFVDRDAALRALRDALPESERGLISAAAIFDGDAPFDALPDVATALGASGVASHAADRTVRLAREGLLVSVPRPAALLEVAVRIGSEHLRRVLLDALDPDTLARAHASAARWLARESHDDGHGSIARLAAHAEHGGARALAAYAWEEAGRTAAPVDAPLAASLLERALERAATWPEAAESVDVPAVLALLAEVITDAGDAPRAEALAIRALEVAQPSRVVLRARMHGLRARALVDRRALEPALAAIEEGLALLGPEGDPQELASLLAHQGWIVGYLQGENARGIALGRRALEVAARIDAPAFRASLCGRLGANLLRDGDWDGQLAINQEDLALSTQARDPRGTIRAHVNLGVCFTNRGDLPLARAHTEEALALSRTYGWLAPAQIAHNNLAMIALDEGRDDEARVHAREVLALHARLGLARGIGETWITLARLALREGAIDEAERAIAQARAIADAAEDEVAARVAARARLAAGDVEGARAELEPRLTIAAHDPYERATTQLVWAAVLRASGNASEGLRVEAEADAVLARLGADRALERARWVG
ncbi:serine/threonine-protein kinase [Sandaracinus amylolyticus]|uniref:serine/threonine-protein kinase n=1 Tax=Sandaracinus amylolyticus TaxID=927083 RepID=UPI001F1F9E82|nr:serine/threonine-protein kinase [Sandaracinus amylolyticus]UJR86277.1 Hypothetical protein I5071_83590 [Sandaracinus amylolyticus]